MEKKKQVRKPKKGKKEHRETPDSPNFENPVAENGAPLFVEPVQNHNDP